jgi:hypothetical protein
VPPTLPPPEVLEGLDPQALPREVLLSTRPLLLRGLVHDWPAVQAATRSPQDAAAYLQGCWQGASVGILLGPPAIQGRFFYNDSLQGFNFERQTGALDQVLQALMNLLAEPAPPALYVGSTTVDTCLPGFRAHNDLGFQALVEPGSAAAVDPLVSVWLGNRTRIAAHFDLPDNIACVVAGHRRFTLFPPEQLPNLYVGPLDLTPAGQAISLVDFYAPDLQRFPRFAQALEHALVAELGPGDALFIPSLWWHHVEALDPFNVLVNYWWRRTPAHLDSPMAALMLALMTVRDLPAEQRRAWQGLFQHYVFDADAQTSAHIPAAAQGSLAPMTAHSTAVLRARLLKRLHR